MPRHRIWMEAGVFLPEELSLLSRVFERSASAEESGRAAEQRASRILAYYQSGIRDEDELANLARQPLRR